MQSIAARMRGLGMTRHFGQVSGVHGGLISATGLNSHASLGDRVVFSMRSDDDLMGEIVALHPDSAAILPEGPMEGLSIGTRVELVVAPSLAPANAWIGRIIDPFGRPLDGRPLLAGGEGRGFRPPPPPAASRNRLGARLETGLAVFDTILPLVRGQRMGLFAGSGVGKSTLLSALAKGVSADVVVIALVGERGRELREFVEETLGQE
ncbi:MAG: flagellum-specific ATP synthase FliI, partial [Paracoccus sp.]|nr:flagellum-specific ATP synthase FliI [Paracoccus sp. (in: a-proteobacteria)]